VTSDDALSPATAPLSGTATGPGTLESMILNAPPSRVLSGQWIGRVLGPWRRLPAMTPAVRSAVRLDVHPAGRSARVVR
jgi:hypothetical protein